MKKLLVAFTVLFLGLNFVACSQKKDNKTRLTRGAGRTGELTVEQNAGWSMLNSKSTLVEVMSQNPDAAARGFMGDVFQGASQLNAVQMQLTFNGSQVSANSTRAGFAFYDDLGIWENRPYTYYMGPETGTKVTGYRQGSNVSVIFDDGGTVEIVGTINGSNFQGYIRYDGGAMLGDFSIPVSRSVFSGY